MRIKQVKYMLFALICMCVTPIITHAECDYQRRAELSRLASNIQVAYTYDTSDFTVYVSNLTSDLYITDNYGLEYYGDGKEKTFKVASGTINFDVYSNDPSCKGEKLLRKSITIPTINVFATYAECNQYPNFKYCQNWGVLGISDEQFFSEFNKYKQELSQNLILQNSSGGKSSVLESILDVLDNNKYMIIFLGIVGGITLITVLIKKKIHK